MEPGSMGTIIAGILENRNITQRPLEWSKSFPEMTEEKREAYYIEKCKLFNESPGNLNEKDGYECPICKNRGYIWVVSRRDGFYENGADFSEAQRDCKCKPIRAAIMRMKRSGLESVIKKYTFNSFKAETPYQRYMLEKAQQFTRALQELKDVA